MASSKKTLWSWPNSSWNRKRRNTWIYLWQNERSSIGNRISNSEIQKIRVSFKPTFYWNKKNSSNVINLEDSFDIESKPNKITVDDALRITKEIET